MGPSKIASMNPPLMLAFSDYGGIGFEFRVKFYSTVVKPHFEKLRVGEGGPGGARAPCGSGWDARKKKSEFTKFLQRAQVCSITIAMGNLNSRLGVLGCMRHDSDWRSTAPQFYHWQTWSL